MICERQGVSVLADRTDQDARSWVTTAVERQRDTTWAPRRGRFTAHSSKAGPRSSEASPA